jgi:hypothetical protein
MTDSTRGMRDFVREGRWTDGRFFTVSVGGSWVPHGSVHGNGMSSFQCTWVCYDESRECQVTRLGISILVTQ